VAFLRSNLIDEERTRSLGSFSLVVVSVCCELVQCCTLNQLTGGCPARMKTVVLYPKGF